MARPPPRQHQQQLGNRNADARIVHTRDVIASVPLQMFLSFHCYFSAIYTFLFCFVFRWKYLQYSDNVFITVLTPILFTIWVICEILRLRFGIVGNLNERPSSLSAFLFLTTCPQIVLNIYFAALQPHILPFDRIWSYTQMSLSVFHLICGWFALRRLIRYKTARFSVEYGMQSQANANSINSSIDSESQQLLLGN